MKFLLHNQCGVFISQAVQTFPYSFLPKFNARTSTLLWLRKHGGESSPRQRMAWERRLSGLNFNGRWEEESPDKIPKPDDLGKKHMWSRIKTAERHELLSGLRPYYNRSLSRRGWGDQGHLGDNGSERWGIDRQEVWSVKCVSRQSPAGKGDACWCHKRGSV